MLFLLTFSDFVAMVVHVRCVNALLTCLCILSYKYRSHIVGMFRAPSSHDSVMKIGSCKNKSQILVVATGGSNLE
jgi:hypothetical protein